MVAVRLGSPIVDDDEVCAEENGGVRSRGRRLVLAAVQDGGDGLVGARVEQERPRTSGVDALPIGATVGRNLGPIWEDVPLSRWWRML